jgi:FkbM family methyltransferase
MTIRSSAVSAMRATVPRAVRNWLRDPRQSIEWATDCASFALGRTVDAEVLPGWTVRAHPLAARRAYVAQHADPAQRLEIEAFVRMCRPGMRLFDIGAHFGVFSLAALHFGGPTAAAVAVDPSPTAARMLRRQAALNGLERRLLVVEACVGDTVGETGMLDTGVIGAGYYVQSDGRQASDLASVAALTVDELARRTDIVPTHLKIDVEGAELDVIQGARGILSQRRPFVSLELHNDILRRSGRDPRMVVGCLEEYGYRLEDVEGEGGLKERSFTREVSRLVAWPSTR